MLSLPSFLFMARVAIWRICGSPWVNLLRRIEEELRRYSKTLAGFASTRGWENSRGAGRAGASRVADVALG